MQRKKETINIQEKTEFYNQGVELIEKYLEFKKNDQSYSDTCALEMLQNAESHFEKCRLSNNKFCFAECNYWMAVLHFEKLQFANKPDENEIYEKIYEFFSAIQDGLSYSNNESAIKRTREIGCYKLIHWIYETFLLLQEKDILGEEEDIDDIYDCVINIHDLITFNDDDYKPSLKILTKLISEFAREGVFDKEIELVKYAMLSVIQGDSDACQVLINYFKDSGNLHLIQLLKKLNASVKKSIEEKKTFIPNLAMLNEILIQFKALLMKIDIDSMHDAVCSIYSDLCLLISEQPLGDGYTQEYLSSLQIMINVDYESMHLMSKDRFIENRIQSLNLLKQTMDKLGDYPYEKEAQKEIPSRKNQKKSKNARRKKKRLAKKSRASHIPIKQTQLYQLLSKRAKYVKKAGLERVKTEEYNLNSMVIAGFTVNLPNKIKAILAYLKNAFLVGSQARERMCFAGIKNLDEVERRLGNSDTDFICFSKTPTADHFPIEIEGNTYLFTRDKYIKNLFTNKDLNIDIKFTDTSIMEDALLRDFYLNVFYIDVNGNVYAPLENSAQHLIKEKVKPVNKTTFITDPTCILRYITLLAKGYRGTISPSKLKKYYSYLSQCNNERKYSRLTKMFSSGYAVKIWDKMQEFELDTFLFPGINTENKEKIKEKLTELDEEFQKILFNTNGEKCTHGDIRPLSIISLFLVARLQSDIDNDVLNDPGNLQSHLKLVLKEFDISEIHHENITSESSVEYFYNNLNFQQNKKEDSNQNIQTKCITQSSSYVNLSLFSDRKQISPVKPVDQACRFDASL